jgi:hypothetical protein
LRRFLSILWPLLRLALAPAGCAELRLDPVPGVSDGAASASDGSSPDGVGGGVDRGGGGAAGVDAGGAEAAGGPVGPGDAAPAADAGVPDAAASDRPTDRPVDSGPAGPMIGGPSRCPDRAYICDGFETGGLDPSLWYGFAEPGAAYAPDATRAARGRQAMRLHVDAMSTEPVGFGSGPLADRPLPNPVWVRFFVFMPDDVPRFDGAFVTLDNDRSEEIGVDWWDRGMKLSGRVTRMPEVMGVPAHGRWVCLLVKQQTAGGSELSVFVDGSQTPTLTSPMDGAPIFHRVLFAISPDGTHTRPLDLWIDEVLVSATPVGCQD